MKATDGKGNYGNKEMRTQNQTLVLSLYFSLLLRFNTTLMHVVVYTWAYN